jgi:hypothetical protein
VGAIGSGVKVGETVSVAFTSPSFPWQPGSMIANPMVRNKINKEIRGLQLKFIFVKHSM